MYIYIYIYTIRTHILIEAEIRRHGLAVDCNAHILDSHRVC